MVTIPNNWRASPHSYDPSQKRDWVMQDGREAPSRALEVAKSIDDPWFRCQALASVAIDFNIPEVTHGLIAESLEAAFSLKQPTAIVCGAAWPVRAMVRSQHPELSATVERLLGLISGVENPVQCADALSALLEAVHPAGRAYRERVLGPFREACRAMKSWKRTRHMRDMACVLHPADPDLAETVLSDLSENTFDRHGRQHLRQARERIAGNECLGPRDFLGAES